MARLLGIDVGGTFTDCAILSDDSGVVVGKAPTTPGRYLDGIVASIANAAGADSVESILADVAYVKHGTTVGTNAIIERKGAPSD
jgi:N-methylhydantoinase A